MSRAETFNAAGPIPAPVLVFAQAMLIARKGGRINIENAHGAFQAFDRSRGGSGLSRTAFGAALAKIAEGAGGKRDGEAATHLAWRENRDRLFPPGFVPAPIVSAEEVAAASWRSRMSAPGDDALQRFMRERLVEDRGHLVSLEALKAAADEAGLSHREVIAAAKARGHAIRKNAWGPDYLTDAALIEPRKEAAE